MTPAAWLDRLHALPAPVRLAGGAAVLALALAPVAFWPGGPSAAQLQSLLLAAVLLAALMLGLGAGLVGATLGFGYMLWRAVEPVAGEGWTLGVRPVLDAFLWFAVAKLAAALTAVPLGLVRRLADAGRASEAQLRRREMLLSELSHRVQNDFNALVAMLEMQASADPEAAEALRAAAGRVLVLGRVHGRLSRGGGAEAVVDSRVFLEGLVADLRAGIEGLRPVALTVEAESHPLPLARASDLGLAANELVTNALKHAFPGGGRGVVRVGFRRDGDTYELAVADNGVGASAAALQAPGGQGTRGQGLGGQIVRALAAYLGGRLDVARGEVGGTVCRLRVPVSPPAQRDAPQAPPVAARDGHGRAAGPDRARGERR